MNDRRFSNESIQSPLANRGRQFNDARSRPGGFPTLDSSSGFKKRSKCAVHSKNDLYSLPAIAVNRRYNSIGTP